MVVSPPAALFPVLSPGAKQLDNMDIDARGRDDLEERLIAADIETGPPAFDDVVHGVVPPPPDYAQLIGDRATGGTARMSTVRGEVNVSVINSLYHVSG